MNMLQKCKYVVCGMVIMLVISMGLTPALASAITRGFQTIRVYYNDYKLMVNGEQFRPVDPDGNAIELFHYNGYVYGPVRQMLNGMG